MQILLSKKYTESCSLLLGSIKCWFSILLESSFEWKGRHLLPGKKQEGASEIVKTKLSTTPIPDQPLVCFNLCWATEKSLYPSESCLPFWNPVCEIGEGLSVYLQCWRPGFNPWVGQIPWRRKWQLTPVLLPGKSHGQRSLVGYSPWDRKVLDTTEWLLTVSLATRSVR